ncbi:polysaccharide pyruvyl transferase family protein [Limosilactobacillus reuteri]|uniref:polysaccharide pyruvyl transferase family protein n=1 Tax=Limosilactobacillus reuteri TaxID=1598 RepID=UPI001CDD08CE|nr:polysaccharide pyruvyl transferase family protein [Limosilactobacillus reuteri]
MDKKIGIMSMQRIFNYGSFLQAYSLKNIIKDLEYNVQFIDYHPGETIISKDKVEFLLKVNKIIQTLKLRVPIKEKVKYLKYKKNYAKNYYPYLGITEEKRYKTSDLDTLIIGSDEVFNCIQDNPNVGFSEDLFGVNNQAKKLISYGASFGNTTISKLQKYNLTSRLSNWLSRFDALSVRDSNSEQIVSVLTGKLPVLNLDPVLIYFNKEKLNLILKKNKTLPRYILLYGYNGRFSRSECKIIKKFADNRQLKIICIGGVQHYCDEFIDCDPFTVLNYFYNAEFVITDTFHGTIMSIINSKKFVTLVRDSGYGNSQKVDDLLKRLKLVNRKLNVIENLESCIEKEIDYEYVNEKLERERNKSINYLKNNLT